MQIQSFINGEPSSSKTQFIKKNPFTTDDLHQVSSAEPLNVVRALQSAQKFYLDWKSSTPQTRLELLQKIRLVLINNKIDFAKLEALDQGLPLQFVQTYSIESLILFLDRLILELNSSQSDLHSPVGVISIIGSWNLSLRILCERIFLAIAAGNTVVAKVSSSSPVTAFVLQRIIKEAGFDPGMLQVIVSDDLEVKKLLVSHPGIRAVSFVGQLQNATTLLGHFKKLQISTGTKNSAVVLTEPEEKTAKEILSSFLLGQGQLAWNSSRLFILEKYEKLWVDFISSYLADLKPSQGVEDSSLWTPCLKKESFTHFEQINQLAIQDQAKLIQAKLTQNNQKNSYLPITFTKDMSNCSTLQQDQISAPLFIISTVKYPFDIAKYSNVSYFGFAAHLWGEEEKLNKIASQFEVGNLFVNKWSVQAPGPRAAIKQSGYGIQDYRIFGDFYSNAKILT